MSHSRQDAPNAGSICDSSLAGFPNAQCVFAPEFDLRSRLFENNGDLLIFPLVHRESLKRLGIPPDEKRDVGAFSEGQRRYLEYQRDLVFLEPRVDRR
jgi:hypothetical protein